MTQADSGVSSSSRKAGDDKSRANASAAFTGMVEAFPDRPHMRAGRDSWTYRQSDTLVRSLAGGLRRICDHPGSRIGILMSNHPAYIVSLLAIWRCGFVAIGLNPMNPPKALAEIGNDAELCAIISLDDPTTLAAARQLANDCGEVDLVIARADMGDLKDVSHRETKAENSPREWKLACLLRQHDLEPHRTRADDLAAIAYTGGTTGKPKGAMLTHGNFIAAAEQMVAFYTTLEPGHEKFLAAAPFTHMGGLQNTINLPSAVGAQITIVERFVAPEILDLIAEERLTFLLTIPTMLVALMREPAFESVDWSAVRTIVAGGSPLAPETRRRFEQVVGTTVRNGYGLTETTGVGAIMPGAPSDSPTATGLPLPEVAIEIRDIDDPAKCLPTGSRGEIYMAGPHVFQGYWHNARETRLALDGRFMRTGDVGFIDSEGLLHVIDRLKDIIIASGFNIYPARVEAAISEHPQVTESMVFGVPDNYRGETVKALIRLKDGAILSRAALNDFLKDRLSAVEAPKIVEFVDTLPTTATGKLSRAAARRGA